MNPSRETIDAALFATLTTVAGLTTAGRDLVPWDKVESAEQPAVFQVAEDEEVPGAARTGGGSVSTPPSRCVLMRSWVLYVHRATAQAATGQATLSAAVNVMLDRLEVALAPGVGQMKQTLGGLVADCRIAGTITRDGGVLGDQGVAIIPLELVTC